MRTNTLKRIGVSLAIGGFLASSLTACSNSNSDTPEAQNKSSVATADGSYPVVFNSCGKDVTFDKAPEKILTAGPTSAIYAASLAEKGQYVYRSGEFSDPNPQADALGAEILSEAELSTEEIIDKGVDLLITDTFNGFDSSKVEAAGVKVIVPNSSCVHAGADGGSENLVIPKGDAFELISTDLRDLGKVVGQPKRGEEQAKSFEKDLGALGDSKPGNGKTAVMLFYFSADYPVMSVSNASFEGQMMERLGLKNIFADEEAAYLEEVNWESVLDKNPDVIIIKYGRTGSTFKEDKDRLLTEPGANTLDAVKNDNIIGISNHNTWPTPEVKTALDAISDKLK